MVGAPDGAPTYTVASMGPIFAADGGIYIFAVDGAGNYEAYFYSPSQDKAAILAEDFGAYTEGRLVDAFLGPDQLPWVCSEHGALIDVAGISSGSGVPISPADLENVLTCGWDDSLGEFLIISATSGLHRVTDDGTTALVAAPDEDKFTIAGAGLY